ncbi:MAG: DUF4080 domain-containing protein, partial [Lachnospiraceae bacterium]|nr:DUF4080 domain-containing protein [Lachnospiraceae bacterium]
VLSALNSKFIHSSLALRSIMAYCGAYEEHLILREFTINNSEDFILRELNKIKPQVICFSCYIWNIEMIKSICGNLRKILKETIIVLGGPEVSYEIEFENLNADIIITGEGEATFKELAERLINEEDFYDIDGIAYQKDGRLIKNKDREFLDLNTIPFVYQGLEGLENKILYYESSRGCPFSCQYCLSSVEHGVRFLSIQRVKEDLTFFYENRPKQVKFVDRTFNCNKKHALFIWQYLIEKDNGFTNYHFEISADLLDDEMISTLEKARPGLFQLEIGVQSTNWDTLGDIKRRTNLDKLFEKVKKVKSFHNIHQHLDLIVGLPKEGYESFKKSFNDVYAVKADMLQIGFLKLLRGSGLRRDAKKNKIVYKETAPYEVLYTNELTYDEFLRLKLLEEVFETYYNSGKFKNTLEYAVNTYSDPFSFYESFMEYWEDKEHHKVSHSKIELFNILFDFLSDISEMDMRIACDLLKFDLFLNENIKNLPQWAKRTDYAKLKENLDSFYDADENKEKYFKNLSSFNAKQLARMCHIEEFEYDVYTFSKTGNIKNNKTYILFNYYERDALSNDAKYDSVTL